MQKFIIFLLCVSSAVWQLCCATEMPIASKTDMVVTEQHLASEVGANILRAGGNAVDAAVAVGYALAVVNPCCGNIGGGGFMLLHLRGNKNIFINFRERAPLAATPAMFLDKNGKVITDETTTGYLAVATPGTVMGLETALHNYGTMTRQQVMAPAITLAREGFLLSERDIKLFKFDYTYLEKLPNIARIFLNKDQPFKVGERLIQNNLADTLQLISDQGTDAFYKGKIAKEMVAASQVNGGILSMKDFQDYYVEVMTPVHCQYRGYEVYSAPPPSSGGVTLCEILNIVEGYPLSTFQFHSPISAHYVIEAMRYAFADRNSKLGDPDFVNNPIDSLLSKKYAEKIRQRIPVNRAIKSRSLNRDEFSKEGVNTTHYSVVDKFGNAVAVTYTLNSFFGARVIAGDTGFFLNNEMNDFTAKPGVANLAGLIVGDKNKIESGKRPLSSMAPTILTQGMKPIMVLGSPGGPRIITATLETILNVLDYHLNLKQAVDAPRFHQQWLPEAVDIEPDSFSPLTLKRLIKMGYTFTPQPVWGAVEAIYIDPETHILYGANDRRRPAGSAVGY